MAISKCVKCNGMTFELKEVSPQGGRYKKNFVQCSSCGTPYGVLDAINSGPLLEKQGAQIASISSQLDEIRSALTAIQRHLREKH